MEQGAGKAHSNDGEAKPAEERDETDADRGDQMSPEHDAKIPVGAVADPRSGRVNLKLLLVLHHLEADANAHNCNDLKEHRDPVVYTHMRMHAATPHHTAHAHA